MSEILELTKPPQNDRVAEMEIGAGGIDAQFDAERPAEREFLPELRLADDLGSALLENGKSFVRLHTSRDNAVADYLLLFNNSRTCSMVSGLFFVRSAFWLLPSTRNGRLPANSRGGVAVVLSGAT